MSTVLNRIPLVIPDKILVDTCNKILDIIRDDYKAAINVNRENESLLYLLLEGTNIGKYDMYANAKKIFITTPQNPKHIDSVTLSYDHQSQSKAPSIFITLPSENSKNNSIGIGEGDQKPLTLVRNSSQQDQYRAQYSRRYLATYNVVIVCENRDEMLVIYNVLKPLLVACTNNFAFLGLSNMQIGGQDLSILQIPDRAFKRAITMSFEYEQVVPSLVIQNIFRTIKLFWEPEGATTAQGPIIIQNDDDLISSSSE